MELPIIAGTRPIILELPAGTYYWCSCGRSKTQPWCDGSHAGTGLSPREVVLPADQRVAMCTCKQTKNSPFCDGSHKAL